MQLYATTFTLHMEIAHVSLFFFILRIHARPNKSFPTALQHFWIQYLRQ